MYKSKVAIVDNSIGITGALNAIVNFTEYSKMKYQFTYILPKGSTAISFLKSKGYDVFELPFVELSTSIKSIITYIPLLIINAIRLKRILKKSEVEIVHVNDFYNLAPALCKTLGHKSFYLTHIRFIPSRFPSLLRSLWLKIHLSSSNYLIGVSEAVMDQLPVNEKIIKIYDGVPEFNRKGNNVQAQSNKVVLLYLSHFIKGKGQDYAVSAFAKAFKSNPNIRMMMVGGDLGLAKNAHFKKGIEKQVLENGLQDVVSIHTEKKDVYELYNATDIFINFSESESFSMTTLEALNAGLPVIVTDCGGPSELFVNGESGMLVPNRDINIMADAIVSLSNDGDLRTKFSINGVAYVEQKFSSENTFEKLQTIYASVLGNKE